MLNLEHWLCKLGLHRVMGRQIHLCAGTVSRCIVVCIPSSYVRMRARAPGAHMQIALILSEVLGCSGPLIFLAGRIMSVMCAIWRRTLGPPESKKTPGAASRTWGPLRNDYSPLVRVALRAWLQ
jgi:hypothetical protein